MAPLLRRASSSFVNGDPITAIDVEQRSKFIMLTTQKPAPRQEVLDQLIDEKLKIREARRWGIEATDQEVEQNFSAMARRMGQSGEQLTQNLGQKGVNSSTLKARIRADIVWQSLVRGRYSSRLQLSDKEILNHLETTKPAERDAVGYEYALRPILFLVAPGAPAATYDARRREAEALRKSFKGCTESIPAVRAMQGVAVRAQVTRSSADLAGRAAQGPRQRAPGRIDRPRSHAPRHRDVCSLLQERNQDRYARPQTGA